MVTDSGARSSSQNLLDILEHLQIHALTSSSHWKYSATWSQWNSWCGSNSLSPWLTENPRSHSLQLVQFAVWCWTTGQNGRGNIASTILSKIGHISWYHRRFCGFSLHEGHQLAMQGMARLSPVPERKRPITVSLHLRIQSRCDFKLAHDRILWGCGLGLFLPTPALQVPNREVFVESIRDSTT